MKINKRLIKRLAVTACVAVPALFVLAPFPGMGMIYSIVDPLRGHPHRPHGTQPNNFVGMWMQEEPEMYGFRASAFILESDSQVADGPGMSFRRWHVDKGSFFVDHMSRCGNCFAGNQTGRYDYEFDGDDRMKLTHVKGSYDLRYKGWYRRVELTDEFVQQLEEDSESYDDPIGCQAGWALHAIEQYESRQYENKTQDLFVTPDY